MSTRLKFSMNPQHSRPLRILLTAQKSEEDVLARSMAFKNEGTKETSTVDAILWRRRRNEVFRVYLDILKTELGDFVIEDYESMTAGELVHLASDAIPSFKVIPKGQERLDVRFSDQSSNTRDRRGTRRKESSRQDRLTEWR